MAPGPLLSHLRDPEQLVLLQVAMAVLAATSTLPAQLNSLLSRRFEGDLSEDKVVVVLATIDMGSEGKIRS